MRWRKKRENEGKYPEFLVWVSVAVSGTSTLILVNLCPWRLALRLPPSPPPPSPLPLTVITIAARHHIIVITIEKRENRRKREKRRQSHSGREKGLGYCC
ncbi:hypothetical protein Dimus_020980 [Dionaea muscipula]